MQVSRLKRSGRYHNEKCKDKMREEKQKRKLLTSRRNKQIVIDACIEAERRN